MDNTRQRVDKKKHRIKEERDNWRTADSWTCTSTQIFSHKTAYGLHDIVTAIICSDGEEI